MISSSMMEVLTGVQHDWATNTSAPRTFSSILTRISPSLKEETVASPRLIPRCPEISRANAGFAFPENSLISLSITPSVRPGGPDSFRAAAQLRRLSRDWPDSGAYRKGGFLVNRPARDGDAGEECASAWKDAAPVWTASARLPPARPTEARARPA